MKNCCTHFHDFFMLRKWLNLSVFDSFCLDLTMKYLHENAHAFPLVKCFGKYIVMCILVLSVMMANEQKRVVL